MPDFAVDHKKKIFLFVLLGLFSVAVSYLLTSQPLIRIRSDHFSRWYATHMLVTEQRSLYDPRNGEEVVALNTIPFDPVEGSFFYPAYLIVFTLPLAWLPYPAAHFIWLIFIQLLFILGIWLLYKETHWPRTVNQLTLLLLLSILFIPNLQNTIWGQFNTIAVVSLALVYMALRRQRFFLAGLLATGMMFKPQQMFLTVGLLLFWALFERQRRRFVYGFGSGMLGLWLFASLFEPSWVGSFIEGVRAYSGYLQPTSIIGLLGIPGWISWAFLALFSLWLVVRNIDMPADSTQMAGCILLSLGIWWLYVPVVGMLHLAAAPVALVLLLAGLEKAEPGLYRFGMLAFLCLYVSGLLGFLYGLSSPGLYGLHIQLAELCYKLALPILLVLLAIPLAYARSPFILGQPAESAR